MPTGAMAEALAVHNRNARKAVDSTGNLTPWAVPVVQVPGRFSLSRPTPALSRPAGPLMHLPARMAGPERTARGATALKVDLTRLDRHKRIGVASPGWTVFRGPQAVVGVAAAPRQVWT